MNRILTTAALAATTLITATSAMASTAWTTNGVNFRSGPGTYYDVIGYLPRCADVATYEYQDGWVEVRWDGATGWVAAKYLAESNYHCSAKKKSYGGSSY